MIFRLPRLQGEWATDTVDGRVKSSDGNRYAQIFTNQSYFATIYTMYSKAKAGDALRTFCQEFGVPERLTMDGGGEQAGRKTEFMKQVMQNRVQVHLSEPALHNQNPAEGVIREVRKRWYCVMFKKQVPWQLWDYGMRWVCDTMQCTCLQGNRIDGGILLQLVTGETVDISEYLDFGFYHHVWYWDNNTKDAPKPG